MACRRMTVVLWMLLPVVAALSAARADEGPFTVLLKGNLTTSSQLYYDPNSADPVERSLSYPITDSFGGGIELKYQFPETHIALSLSTEYVRATTTRSIDAGTGVLIPVEDGYSVVPVEVTGYFLIPVGGTTFGIYMGGGGGVYIGRRTYAIGGTSAGVLETTPGYGIHVLGGVTYRFTDHFSVIGEMKFRDLQFQSTNAFSSSSINYLGSRIVVSQKPFDATIHTDGIIFQLGAAINF